MRWGGVCFTPKSGRAATAFKESAKCQKRTLLPLDVWLLVGSIEVQLSLIKTSFLDGMLRFVTAIAGWILLPVGRFFRQSKLT